MTGQVKEDVLCRFGELGVFVDEGKLYFNPRLLRTEEFLSDTKDFHYTNINKEQQTIALEKGSLCFTYCQVPVIYKLKDDNKIEVKYTDGSTVTFEDLKLDVNTSNKIFNRTGEVNQIIVSVKK